MILRNSEILMDNFLDGVRKLLKVQMPMKISFKLAQSVKIISAQYDLAVEKRTELIKQYGKDNGAGGFDVRLSPKEDQEKFFNELNELYNIEFEIPLEGKIDPDKINFKDDDQMSTLELIALGSVLKLNEDEVPPTVEAPAPTEVQESKKD